MKIDEAGGWVIGFKLDQLTAEAVGQVLEQYPSAQGWYFPGHGKPTGEQTPHGWGVLLAWKADDTSTDARLAKLSEVAPEYQYRGHRWLRPAVGTQRDYLEPLAAWWILLYGLSMVARYEPAAWAKVLAINESEPRSRFGITP
jgi:hypothetical protein